MKERIAACRRRLAEAGVEALLVTSAVNRRYLSGFRGSAGYLLIGPLRATLFTDGRYQESAPREVFPPIEVVVHGRPAERWLSEWLRQEGIGRLGFEAEALSFKDYETYRQAFAPTELVPLVGVVQALRQVKAAQEIEALQRAAAITEDSLAAVLPTLQLGITERELALALEWEMRRRGADGVAFPLIVAFGPNSALPHAVPGTRRLAPHDLVIFDVGAVWDGYHADLTRTYVAGAFREESRRMYDVVLAAEEAALEVVQAGRPAAAVDRAARAVIEAAGFGAHFVHSTGHGVGLEIHEAPHLTATSTETLEEGMVVTVEPGIYLPGFGGVRIEDTVVVRPEGAEVLTRSCKAEPILAL